MNAAADQQPQGGGQGLQELRSLLLSKKRKYKTIIAITITHHVFELLESQPQPVRFPKDILITSFYHMQSKRKGSRFHVTKSFHLFSCIKTAVVL